MDTVSQQARAGHRLLQMGMLLFLLGLLTGFVSPTLANSRMGLSSHLEGVMNGTFLIALGLIWPKLLLGRPALAVAFWLAIYGTFANWIATLLAAAWGAGAPMMPIAAAGHTGSGVEETVIRFLLLSVGLAMVAICMLSLWGLRMRPASS
jgi:hydroxylaminobenzene mutase